MVFAFMLAGGIMILTKIHLLTVMFVGVSAFRISVDEHQKENAMIGNFFSAGSHR